MSTYHTLHAEIRELVARQAAVADKLRHTALRGISRDLHAFANTPPPTYVETATALGFNETADRINAWNAAGKPGDWRDPEFDPCFDGDQEEGAS